MVDEIIIAIMCFVKCPVMCDQKMVDGTHSPNVILLSQRVKKQEAFHSVSMGGNRLGEKG
jgi:hypothetical protein